MDEKSSSKPSGADTTSKHKLGNDNNNGSTVSNTPRKRVSQACDRCRSRKDKCDGGKPRCSTCASLDQVCFYDKAVKKRGLPEGYVRGLEKLWGLTIREADGIEETVLNILNSGADPDGEILLKVWNDREESETLQETWRKSRISQELDRLLPILESSDDKAAKRRRTGTDSHNTNADFKFPFQGPPTSDYGHSIEFSIPTHTVDHRKIEVPQFGGLTGSSKPLVDNRTIQVPARTWQLLDVYFSYTHCWLPIVEKHDMLRTSYQYSTKLPSVSPSLPGSGDHAALWAILSYAEHQNKVIKNDLQPQELMDDWNVESLYVHARSLIPLEDGVFELGHVQALLILALLNMGRNQWDRAWLLVGQAGRIAINLGLDEGIKDSKSVERKTRSTHVFLGCFVLDTLIAANLGRSPQLSNDDVRRAGAVEEDGSDEWNPWTDALGVRRGNIDGTRGPVAVLSTFNRLIKLVEILNTISHDTSSGARRTELCQGLMNELSSWGQVLPSQFASNSTSRESTGLLLLPHQYHLHLAHIGIISALYAHVSVSAKALQVSEQTLSDTFATAARQAMWLLMRQSESFGLLIVPPTFDFFISIACDRVLSPVTDKHISHSDWERNMQHYLEIMSKAWPTFEGRKAMISARLSLVHDGTFGTPSTKDTPTSQPTPSLHMKQTSTSGSVFGLPTNKNTSLAQHNTAGTPLQYDPLLELSTTASLQSITNSTSNWPDQTHSTTQFSGPAPADYLNFPHHGSISSDLDGDSMFNEFATMDAMEW